MQPKIADLFNGCTALVDPAPNPQLRPPTRVAPSPRGSANTGTASNAETGFEKSFGPDRSACRPSRHFGGGALRALIPSSGRSRHPTTDEAHPAPPSIAPQATGRVAVACVFVQVAQTKR